MPIYDYVCSSCSTRTEIIHGIEAPAPRFCPVCGAEDTLRKVFVAPTVHFKGSGWAKKDRSASSTSKTKAAAATDAGSGDGSTGSTGGSGGSGDGATASGGDTGSSKGSTESTAGKGASSGPSKDA